MHSPPEPNAATLEIEHRLREDKLRLLFHQSFPGLFISLASALIYCWMSWPLADRTLLAAWLVLVAVASLGRLALFLSYFRAEPRETNALRWQRPYIVSLLASALIWGLGMPFVMASAESPMQHALTMFVLIGMAGGAIATYSALRLLASGAMLAVLLPSTIWLFLQPGQLQTAMAIGASLFMVGTMRSAKVLAIALHRSLRLTHELRRARETAEHLANIDSLTGVNNRRAFLERGEQITRYCQRHSLSLCALVIDIDHFKAINDNHGHSSGDRALRQVGDILRRTLRRSDVCGRLGGEEFAVLLPDTAPAEAHMVAEKLREAIAGSPVALRQGSIGITASIGVASHAYELEALLHDADGAMYRAKATGRNRVIGYAPDDIVLQAG